MANYKYYKKANKLMVTMDLKEKTGDYMAAKIQESINKLLPKDKLKMV